MPASRNGRLPASPAVAAPRQLPAREARRAAAATLDEWRRPSCIRWPRSRRRCGGSRRWWRAGRRRRRCSRRSPRRSGGCFRSNTRPLGRYEPDGTVTSSPTGRAGGHFPVGSRWPLGGMNVATLVFETGRPARIDDYADATGPLGVAAGEAGIRSAVGAPIMVEGRLWGSWPPARPGAAAAGGHRGAPRLVHRARRDGDRQRGGAGRGARLAEEQAALRRVATLVAGGVRRRRRCSPRSPRRSGGCWRSIRVAGPVRGRANMVRRHWPPAPTSRPPSAPARLGGERHTRSSAPDGPAGADRRLRRASGASADASASRGIRSSVGVPDQRRGPLCGAAWASASRSEPLPADTEARLAAFTELVATAIANAESRVGLARLAEEQAALRRVATLVARGAPPEEVFAAVTEEVGRLLGADLAAMARYKADDTVASWRGRGHAAARRSRSAVRGSSEATNCPRLVVQTGRPARIDDYPDASGPMRAVVRGRARSARRSARRSASRGGCGAL